MESILLALKVKNIIAFLSIKILNLGGLMHQYYLKVVPTTYVYGVTGNGREELSHQFSITRTEKDIVGGAAGIPGVFIQYEFSPLMVRYEERKRYWLLSQN